MKKKISARVLFKKKSRCPVAFLYICLRIELQKKTTK